MPVRGIRGATTVEKDQAEEVISATEKLLEAILAANPTLQPEEIASVIFSVTEDLCSTYPAQAARRIGWVQVPLLCTLEIPVPGALPRCIRIMLHWNTNLSQSDIHHVYLNRAVQLRPDWAKTGPGLE